MYTQNKNWIYCTWQFFVYLCLYWFTRSWIPSTRPSGRRHLGELQTIPVRPCKSLTAQQQQHINSNLTNCDDNSSNSNFTNSNINNCTLTNSSDNSYLTNRNNNNTKNCSLTYSNNNITLLTATSLAITTPIATSINKPILDYSTMNTTID